MKSLHWLRWLVCAGIGVFHPLPGGVSAAGAAPLPAIVLAPAGAGFQTEDGKPYVPFGVTYYRPGTGWAPQVWRQFDPAATARDFARMKAAGVNCARVFLSFGSFLPEPGAVSEEGFKKFDQFLSIAEQAGIYVHPTGPDHWEGLPVWAATDRYADETVLRALELFWREFTRRYKGRKVIFAVDLLNEPAIAWETPVMREKWRGWVAAHYPNAVALAQAWGADGTADSLTNPAVPPPRNAPGSRRLLDYQHFREDLADEWTRRQVAVIKSIDPTRLVTAGLVQWSIPSLLPALSHYAAFRPSRLAPMLDFMEVHFYPLEHGFYEYESAESEARNLAYLEGVVRAAWMPGKPLVLAEFGWYSGRITIDNGRHRPATEQDQARWDTNLVAVSKGWAGGWLNWGFYDQPEAGDPSQGIGLFTADGTIKAWGREFGRLAGELATERFTPPVVVRPALDWEACLADTRAGDKFREEYYAAWRKDPRAPAPKSQ